MATFKSQDLYGGAIKAVIPEGWLDASDLRQIPDHQELFLSPTTLSHLIFEINEHVSKETALSSLQSHSLNQDLDVLGPNPEANTETIDKAAVLYHIHDIRESDGDGDAVRIVSPPRRVNITNFPGDVRAYKGIVVITSSSSSSSSSGRHAGGGSGAGVPASIGGAAAGSSADGALGSAVTVHFLVIRLEEQGSDILIWFNVPQKEFDERGDPRGLSREEELGSEIIARLVEGLEVVDWGLFEG